MRRDLSDMTRAAAGTRVPDGYPGNFLLPETTRVPEINNL